MPEKGHLFALLDPAAKVRPERAGKSGVFLIIHAMFSGGNRRLGILAHPAVFLAVGKRR